MSTSLITPRRRNVCGANVAQDSNRGFAVAVFVPVVVMLGVEIVVLSDDFVAMHGAENVVWTILWLLLLSGVVDVLICLVVFADPGVLPPGEVTPVSHLCYTCLIEIEDFDHHCSVLGACIGKGNYGYFLWFLTTVAALCVTGFTLAAQYCARIANQSKLLDRIAENWWRTGLVTIQVFCQSRIRFITAAVLLICAYCAVFSITLVCYHWWLAIRGRHAIARRRRRCAGGGLRGIFATFFKPKCTDPQQVKAYFDTSTAI